MEDIFIAYNKFIENIQKEHSINVIEIKSMYTIIKKLQITDIHFFYSDINRISIYRQDINGIHFISVDYICGIEYYFHAQNIKDSFYLYCDLDDIYIDSDTYNTIISYFKNE